jgi:hypothetical protein
LRRQSYDLNEDGLFNVEYADILGIPFDFAAKPVVAPPQAPRETIQVKAIRPDRDALGIHFPRVQGYRVELPVERLEAEFNDESIYELSPDVVGPSITKNSGIIGADVDLSLKHVGDMRHSSLVLHLTKRLLYTKWRDAGEDPQLYLFGQLKRITKNGLIPVLFALVERIRRSSCIRNLPIRHVSALRRDQAEDHRQVADKGHPRPLQSRGFNKPRQLHDLENGSLGDRLTPVSGQLGHPEPQAIAKSRCLILPLPDACPLIFTLYGGSAKTMYAFWSPKSVAKESSFSELPQTMRCFPGHQTSPS